jgi:hypothetical protein
VNRALSAVASRVSWFVLAMLAALGLAWLVMEIGLIRPIARLTRRTRGLSRSVHGDGLERYDLADLRGRDEMGLLAAALDDLLRRAKEDATRERIRAEQEKDMWYGVSDQPESAAAGNRGQGLFVAKTYMAKMGGTVTARNCGEGMEFVLTLQRVAG